MDLDLLQEQQEFLTAGLSLQSQARQFYLFMMLGLRVSSVKQGQTGLAPAGNFVEADPIFHLPKGVL